ncbi:hypothetical protein CEXT_158531 [Caerostris extrusa]|uniref:Uncharacterized protein n=1 Tax=Caerostris extrusa TaxID=172846 RepID=A0AAV4W0K0_CAEEX|nr:hypothetical protein CEXT_158531 [Caerostris extrusa]
MNEPTSINHDHCHNKPQPPKAEERLTSVSNSSIFPLASVDKHADSGNYECCHSWARRETDFTRHRLPMGTHRDRFMDGFISAN